ncbi:alpha/beta hydrolase [Actinopolymorpha sp. B17G11]|uniref:alpha/beta hydrolase n=1 Tax=Actinopolymorpha sp. B17G11 TaxID=3160861 RepID=UPI0032E44DA6
MVDNHILSVHSQLLVKIGGLAKRCQSEIPSIADIRRDSDLGLISLAKGIHPGIRTNDVAIPGPGGRLRVRIYQPARVNGPGPALVYFHGGGFVMGSIETHDAVCRFLATHADVRILSVNYRLAPEHPFPAAVEDAVSAFHQIVENSSQFGVTAHAVAVGGDSAGACLAAVVSHSAVKNAVPPPVFGLLLYPPTDIVGLGFRSQDLFPFVLDNEILGLCRDQYLPDPSLYDDPRVSILQETALRGLPPTYVASPGFDPMRDEGEAYVELLRRFGVDVEHQRRPTLMHGFATFFMIDPEAKIAMLQAAHALRRGLKVRPGKAYCGDGCGIT